MTELHAAVQKLHADKCALQNAMDAEEEMVVNRLQRQLEVPLSALPPPPPPLSPAHPHTHCVTHRAPACPGEGGGGEDATLCSAQTFGRWGSTA